MTKEKIQELLFFFQKNLLNNSKKTPSAPQNFPEIFLRSFQGNSKNMPRKEMKLTVKLQAAIGLSKWSRPGV